MRYRISVRIAVKNTTSGGIGACVPTAITMTNFVTPNRKAIAIFAAFFEGCFIIIIDFELIAATAFFAAMRRKI